LYAWWKPNDLFKLDIGWVRWDALRGISVLESFQNGKYTGAAGIHEDFIFHRFATADWWVKVETYGVDGQKSSETLYNPGAVLEITPLPNLYIGAAIVTGPAGGDHNFTNEIEDVYKNSQYALGYNIDGIGLIRVGYFGLNSQGIGNQLIQGAFKLTAVEGLSLDVGFGYSLDEKQADAKKNNLTVGLAAAFKTDLFGVNAAAGAWLGGDKDSEAYPTVEISVNPYASLDFATIGLGVAYGLELEKDNSSHIGFDVYIEKAFGGGQIKAGVTASLSPGKPDAAKQDITIAIPIELTYSIW
jgi:hypothetical protein